MLLPDVLMPVEPKLASNLRDFAKSIAKWTRHTVEGRPEPFRKAKFEGRFVRAAAVSRLNSPCLLDPLLHNAGASAVPCNVAHNP